MRPGLRAASLASLASWLALVLAPGCGSPPPPEPPRVVAPPEAPTITTPPPRELTICQRDPRPTVGGDAATIASFEGFSRAWVAKMKAVTAARATATERKTLRDTYEMELRPTGSTLAPYVGVLSYCEIALKCADARADSCTPAATTVVKEMFRYQGGKWIY